MSLLQVEDVVVQFGGVTAVNHATFEVQAGSVTGLIGPNGAGKTTVAPGAASVARSSGSRRSAR
jgi:ABC-type branched-subunit amino acid transport system ATPase component